MSSTKTSHVPNISISHSKPPIIPIATVCTLLLFALVAAICMTAKMYYTPQGDIPTEYCQTPMDNILSAKASKLKDVNNAQPPEQAAGHFEFIAPDSHLTSLFVQAQLWPSDLDEQGNNRVVKVIDLRKAFLQSVSPSFTIEMPSDVAYNVDIINGNVHKPLKLRNIRSGKFQINNDESVTDLDTGFRYVLSLTSMPPPVNTRKQSPSFSPAYTRCYNQGVITDTHMN